MAASPGILAPARLRAIAAAGLLLVGWALLIATSKAPDPEPPACTMQRPCVVDALAPEPPRYTVPARGSAYFRHTGLMPGQDYWYVLSLSEWGGMELLLRAADTAFTSAPRPECTVFNTLPPYLVMQCPVTANAEGMVYGEVLSFSAGSTVVSPAVVPDPAPIGSPFWPIVIDTTDLPALGAVHNVYPTYLVVPVAAGLSTVTVSGIPESTRLSGAWEPFGALPSPVCVAEGVGELSCDVLASGSALFLKVELLSGKLQFFTLDVTPTP